MGCLKMFKEVLRIRLILIWIWIHELLIQKCFFLIIALSFSCILFMILAKYVFTTWTHNTDLKFQLPPESFDDLHIYQPEACMYFHLRSLFPGSPPPQGSLDPGTSQPFLNKIASNCHISMKQWVCFWYNIDYASCDCLFIPMTLADT